MDLDIQTRFLVRQDLMKMPVLFGVVGNGMLLYGAYAGKGSVFMAVAALVAIASAMAFWIFWRCPGCKKNLGRDFDPKTCRHCGVTLQLAEPGKGMAGASSLPPRR